MDIKLKKFDENEIDALIPIMKEAFENDSAMHLGKDVLTGPDGYDDGSFIRTWAMHKNATSFSVYDGEKIIGLAILWIRENNRNTLGCLFIDVDYEGKGVGYGVWKMIEGMFPDTVEWNTETPSYSKRNHHFYMDKCGFELVKIDEAEGQYKLKKKMH